MPTCRDIITRAYRKAKILSGGEEPSAEEAQDGLEELQGLYEMWAANGMFGTLTDKLIDTDYDAGMGERLRVVDGAAVSIPDDFEDGTEPPRDMALIEVVDADAETVTRHLYDAGQTKWVNLNGLTLSDEAPLASKGKGGLAACLALILADEFGGEIGPSVLRQAGSFRSGLSLKLGGTAERTAPDWF